MTTLLTMKGFNKKIIDYLCFTANAANSTVQLTKNGSPTAVTLETSTDGINWSAYTFGNKITLSSIGDKVYWRNTSETDTGFSTYFSNYYQFVIQGSMAASGDINFLLNKNSTDTIPEYAYLQLFENCSGLTSLPKLSSASIIQTRGCYYMFRRCSNADTLPAINALSIGNEAFVGAFYGCTNIKLSTTQTGEYVNEYRVPTVGTGTAGTNAFGSMFDGTGGTFAGGLTVNTTYYTSNQVI